MLSLKCLLLDSIEGSIKRNGFGSRALPSSQFPAFPSKAFYVKGRPPKPPSHASLNVSVCVFRIVKEIKKLCPVDLNRRNKRKSDWKAIRLVHIVSRHREIENLATQRVESSENLGSIQSMCGPEEDIFVLYKFSQVHGKFPFRCLRCPGIFDRRQDTCSECATVSGRLSVSLGHPASVRDDGRSSCVERGCSKVSDELSTAKDRGQARMACF